MQRLFSQRRKIFLSPHFDDLALSMGGFLIELAERNMLLEDWVVFSQSHYIVGEGNDDFSAERVARISRCRLDEEKQLAANLGNIIVVPLGQSEAKLRGHVTYTVSETNFILNQADKGVIDFLQENLAPLLMSDCDIFVPLAIGTHIDHLLVRTAVMKLIEDLGVNITANLFFYEDLPYATQTNHFGWLPVTKFIKSFTDNRIVLPIHLEKKLALVDYYPSQNDLSYRSAIKQRAQYAKKRFLYSVEGEIVYRYFNQKTADSTLPFNNTTHKFALGHWRHDFYYWLNYFYHWRSWPLEYIKKLELVLPAKRITTISIVIATRDRVESLKKYSLPSLEMTKLKPGITWEIIIVDSSSDTVTAEYVKSFSGRDIQYFRYANKKNVSDSRNFGVAQAHGDIIVFIDDDCAVDGGWLLRIIDAFDRHQAAVYQGQIYDQYFKKNIVIPEPLYSEQTYFAGNLALRREIFNFVQFNHYLPFFGEDWEMMMRVEFLFPFASYYFDARPLLHYRSSSPFRDLEVSHDRSDLNDKGKRQDQKMSWQWYINRCIIRRNTAVLATTFAYRYWLIELIFFPLELVLINGDITLLIHNKIFLFRWLKKISKLID